MQLDHEQSNRYSLQLDPSLLNPQGALKPQSYQALYCELAERHLAAHDAGSGQTMEYGVAWVLISLSVDVFRPAMPPGILEAKTWKSGRQGPYFMRDFIFYASDGEPCFRGTSYSVLLNLETRTISRDKRIPFFSLTADRAPLTLGRPTWKQAYGHNGDFIADRLELRARRKVENSFLDLLGHVNNIRYGEFVYDAMTDPEAERLKSLVRMEVYFAAELRKRDLFSVSAAEEQDRLFFRGRKDESGETSFDMVLCTK